MDVNAMKYVILVDDSLPKGIAANTAAVLSATVGKEVPQLVGPDVTDGAGKKHRGITTLPIAVLACSTERLRHVRSKAEEEDMLVVGFTRTAQRSRHYANYRTRMAEVVPDDLEYMGVALLGPGKSVTSLTGDLGLLG